ncbi:unnamed protein product, partial [marine sediment metagenome]
AFRRIDKENKYTPMLRFPEALSPPRKIDTGSIRAAIKIKGEAIRQRFKKKGMGMRLANNKAARIK